MVFGAPILVAVLENGEKYVSPRHICEAIGVSWTGQSRKIKEDEVLSACCEDIVTVVRNGANRQMTMLHIDKMSGWLFGINANRVKPEIKPALVKYQTEAFAVLDAWFRKNARAATDPTDMMAMMQETIQKALAPLQVQLEAVVIDNKAMKPKVEAYDSITEEGQKFLLTNVAREVGVGRKALIALLVDGGVLETSNVYGENRSLPTDYAKNTGLTTDYHNPVGTVNPHSFYLTAKGRSLCERLAYDWKAQQQKAA
ncbi:phage antirepressor N-terminal domain-containing protein [Pseudodesulfovibrio methanolicus]|uniref:Phage antirepressor N-terminal domain-containing protein n=1 Tax=Pseudodesulfovibrio methanolicus TaxID=3126690 RepID=A0ABZ2J0R3_9BACT